MNLQQLYYFRDIIAEKSYTRAAAKYFVSTSNLSHAISDLEKELGVRLLNRDSKSLEMTECGRRFLLRAEAAIREIEAIRPDIEAYRNSLRKIIRVNLGHAPNSSIMPSLIRGYLEEMDDHSIQFEINEGTSRQTAQEILARRVDLGLNQYMGEEGVEHIPLYTEELKLIVAADHPLAEREAITAEELVDYPLVVWGSSTGTSRHVERIFADLERKPEIVRHCSSDYVMMESVASGVGVAISAHMKEMALYPLKSITLDEGRWKREYALMWNAQAQPEPLVQSFIDYVKEHFRVGC